jgi:hypothetical protein
VRLTELEELEPVIVSAKKSAKARMQIHENPAKQILSEQLPRPEGRILRLKEVVRMVGLSRTAIYALQCDG